MPGHLFEGNPVDEGTTRRIHWVFVAVLGLSVVPGSRVTLSCYGPDVMWGLSRLGIEPMSPALAGGFLTAGPPGKFLAVAFLRIINCLNCSY